MDNRILLIRTGGTIDSEPYADPKNPPKFVDTLKGDKSLIMPAVASMPNHKNVDGFTWGRWEEDRFVKDSQLFTPDDIQALAKLIKEDDHRFFVITHGTDAMVKNSTALQAELGDGDKVVVFAGAMVPLSMHRKHESDGVETLRYTLANIATQPAGVYIAARDTGTKRMGFFDPQKVEKDRKASLENSRFIVGPSGR